MRACYAYWLRLYFYMLQRDLAFSSVFFLHYCSVRYFPLVLITSIFWHAWLSTPVWTKIQPHHCAHNNFLEMIIRLCL